MISPSFILNNHSSAGEVSGKAIPRKPRKKCALCPAILKSTGSTYCPPCSDVRASERQNSKWRKK